MNAMLQDVRHALRLMSRAPGFTLAALVTLALAIGVNTAVFSAVYGILLRPLPYAGADQIVRLSEFHPGGTAIINDARLSNLTFDAWRGNATTIDAAAAYSSQDLHRWRPRRAGANRGRARDARHLPAAWRHAGRRSLFS